LGVLQGLNEEPLFGRGTVARDAGIERLVVEFERKSW
jgi:hypothetical protein